MKSGTTGISDEQQTDDPEGSGRGALSMLSIKYQGALAVGVCVVFIASTVPVGEVSGLILWATGAFGAAIPLLACSFLGLVLIEALERGTGRSIPRGLISISAMLGQLSTAIGVLFVLAYFSWWLALVYGVAWLVGLSFLAPYMAPVLDDFWTVFLNQFSQN